MQVAIASGKGGTGKTTLASNLAWTASELGHAVTYMDCDVEEPNGHLFLRPEWMVEQSIDTRVPRIDLDECTLCGQCGAFCRFGAIVCVGKAVKVFPEMCHSCGGCTLVCPMGAIQEDLHSIGTTRIGASGMMCIVDGTLRVGQHLGPPAIRAVKKFAQATGATKAASRRPLAQSDNHFDEADCDVAARACSISEYDLRIIDTPPGTSCSMVEAIRDSDLVILVTEPTPFGVHDLQLAIETVSVLNLPMGVVINRSGPNDQGVIDCCRHAQVSILGEIPDDHRVAVAYSDGRLACEEIPGYRQRIERVLDRAVAIMEEPCKN